MHGHSEDVPADDECSRVGLFPRGITYFRRWRSLRWFVILVTPVVFSAADCFLHRLRL